MGTHIPQNNLQNNLKNNLKNNAETSMQHGLVATVKQRWHPAGVDLDCRRGPRSDPETEQRGD
ncbi:hypothetical protein [Synechococcus sp. CBW1107]|uniref:hypothetical protein n=1 Tax=Synechococcus sp. CBW1107 TaxID=2789857 RepID=UPI002AD4656F|nr:hypothetical protein [Synechococcus sp. CBW1107]CAK6698106.1 hypothetical protein IFHNHDMJ_02363 [Synechococcus sp. CBW1107]